MLKLLLSEKVKVFFFFFCKELFLFFSGFQILDDEVVVDFYVAVPEIMTELNPLRKKLKKRFPKATRSKGEYLLF